ncbi:MAG: cupin domain-containing protein [Myxococcota bacterium]
MKAHFLDESGQARESIGEAELRAAGVHYETLPLDGYQPRIDELRKAHGYIQQDEVALRPDTPGLDQALKKFDDEHLHDEDEVRFVLDGAGIFDVRDPDDRWMRVVVERGDLIVVPKGRYHRFELTNDKTIHCVRLFQDKSGWVPKYR